MRDVCRTCGAPVIWLHTLSGREMPLDAEPVADGNLVIVNTGQSRYVVPAPKQAPEPDLFRAPELRYRSHFATCPHAKQHRRKRDG